MFGFWYLFFGCAILMIIGIVFVVIYQNTAVGDWSMYLGAFSLVIGGLGSVAFSIISIFAPINAHREVIYYKELYPTYCMYAEQLKDTDSLGDFAQNTGYLEEIKKYNSWIANAKASKDTYDCFSGYYKEDLSDFQYIFVGQ